MSKLYVNTIYPQSGDEVALSGNLNVSGTLNAYAFNTIVHDSTTYRGSNTFGNDAGDVSTFTSQVTASEGVFVVSGERLRLGATEETIYGDGTDIHFEVGSNGDINIPASVGLTFGNDGEKIEGDGTDLTIASSAELDLTAGTTVDINATTTVTIDGAGVSIDSAGVAANFTVATDGAGEDLTIGLTGATDSSIVISSTGTGADAINIDTTAGSIDIDSADNITIDAADEITIDTTTADGHIAITSAHTAGQSILISANANAGSILDVDAGIIDIDVQDTINIDAADEIEIATTTADGHITLTSAHTAGVAFHLDANADADSEVQIDAGILDIDVTAAATIDAVGVAIGAGSGELDLTTTGTLDINANALDMDLTDSSTITITSSEAGEDLTIAQVGANDSSILITAAGTGADAIGLVAAAGGITLDAETDIVFDANGADVSLKDDGTQFLKFTNNGGNCEIYNGVADTDIIFKDLGGNTIVTIDGADETVKLATNKKLEFGDNGYTTISSTNATASLSSSVAFEVYMADDTGEDDGTNAAFIFKDSASEYMTFSTRIGSEGIELKKNTSLPNDTLLMLGSAGDVRLKSTGTTGSLSSSVAFEVYMADDVGGQDGANPAFVFKDSASSYLTFLTRAGEERMFIDKEFNATNDTPVTFGDEASVKLKVNGAGTTGSLSASVAFEVYMADDVGEDDGTNTAFIFKDSASEYMAFSTRIGQEEITISKPLTITSATATAPGGGFNASDVVLDTYVREINDEIETTILLDIGAGDIVSSAHAGDVIGEDGVANAYFTKITTDINGVVYRGTMACIEVPTTGDPDINLCANSSGTIAEDAGGEGQHILVNGGTWTLGLHEEIDIPAGGIVDDYLYLTHGGTTAGEYDAGKYIIKLYGANF